MARRRTPAARLGVSVVASLAALLLVASAAPALADDTAPPPDTVTTTELQGEAPAEEAPAEEAPAEEAPAEEAPAEEAPAEEAPAEEAPADEAPAEEAPAEEAPAETAASADAPAATKNKIGTLAKAGVEAAALTIEVPCLPGTATVVGGFQIDGDTCAEGGLDWDNTGDHEEDLFAPDDISGFTQGTSENTDPADWVVGDNDPNGKTDIGDAWAFSHVNGGQVYGYFGLTNDSTSGGTSQYDVEYNQLANQTVGGFSVPNRSPGDLLFRFSSSGSDPIEFTDAKIYTNESSDDWDDQECFEVGDLAAGWCTIPIPEGVFAQQVNSDGTFFEGSINLTVLFGAGGDCSGSFGVTQIRSVTGGSFATSALKDYVKPLNVTTPSTCASLVIKKQRAGTTTLLTGAEFDVYAGATATGTPIYDNIADGDAEDTDEVIGQITIAGLEPGTYTVKEVVAPPGYFLPNPDTQTQSVGESGSITFTFNDVKQWLPLDITKNGSGAYDALYNWSIEKRVGDTVAGPFAESLTKDVPFDGAGTTSVPFGYQVKLIQGSRDTSNIVVGGNLLVDNPNNEAVTVTLTDTLDGATCDVSGDVVEIPAGATDYSIAYSCSYPDGTAPADLDTSNAVSMTWSKATYPIDVDGDDVLDADESTGNHTDTAGATIAYTATETNKNVTVTDLMSGGVHHVFDPAWTATWTAEGTVETRTYTESVVAAVGTTTTVVNTAYVKDSATNTELDNDIATAIVRIGADLTVEKVVNTSLTRTYLWDVEKHACTLALIACDALGIPTILGDAEGNATANYTVKVTQTGTEDSAWAMSGTITVSNPNDWQGVTLTDLDDVYSGGGDCAITGSKTGGVTDPVIDWVVPASGSKVFTYLCAFDSANPPALGGTNTATATWDSTAAATPTGTDDGSAVVAAGDWDETPVNKTVHLFDQFEDETPVFIGSATYGVTPSPTYFEYTHPVSSAPGTCSTFDNQAWLSSSASNATLHVAGPDAAQVRVCTAEDLTVAKTAAGTYDRTYHWSLDKAVSEDPESDSSTWTDSAEWTGDVYDHVFGYLVTLSQEPWTDSNWEMTGAITLSNGNEEGIAPIGSSVTDVPDVGADGDCVVAPGGDAGADAGDPLVGYATAEIASGEDFVINYECSFDTLPDYAGGTNDVTATNTVDMTPVPVTFSKTAEHNKTVTVTDDPSDGPVVELTEEGGITYDESDPDATYDLAYTDEHTAEVAGQCTPFPNHAEIVGAAEGDDIDADATASICPNPGTWEVAKTSDPADGGVAAGSDIEYTLTATKTGGVNPENVVIKDDLSDLAPHVALPTEEELNASAPAGTTVDLTGNVLTWTIAELSGSLDLVFTVTVNVDAFDVDLPNLITSPGSDNCPDPADEVPADECTTDHDTPHYLLTKDSDAGATVMPPYLGEPGTVITYELTVFNDSEVDITTGAGGTMPGATVTDDLSDVIDNATFDDDSISPAGQAARVGDTLTWNLPDIPAGESRTLTYQVQVNADQWNETLTNTATPNPTGGGECEEPGDCTTTTDTPPYTLMQTVKVDAETGLPLAGAEFALYQDNEPFSPVDAPVVGAEDELIDTATSNAEGLAQFDEELLRGHFLVEETRAPPGYCVGPTDGNVCTPGAVGGNLMAVVIDDSNFVDGTYMSPFEFRDPAQGQLAIVAKQQFEIDPGTGEWIESDGFIDFGEQVRYVVQVAATGPKIFHNVQVTDYVPGFNPEDTISTAQASLVPGSAICTGSLECEVTVVDGLVTWSAGTVQDAAGTVEMVVEFPEAPENPPFDADGFYTETLWNVGYLAWQEADVTVVQQEGVTRSFGRAAVPSPSLALAEFPMIDHMLRSNEVIIEAVLVEALPPVITPPVGGPTPPSSPTLPNTGGPAGWLPYAGFGLLLLGGLLVVQERRRRQV